MSRLSQPEIDAFLTQLAGEFAPGICTLEKGPSLSAGGYRLWLTLLDDAPGGQLRVRKFTMALVPEPGSTRSNQERRSREWFSASPAEDRWGEIDGDEELSSEELLAVAKAVFLRMMG